jgi:PAS domain S-box-containing protein
MDLASKRFKDDMSKAILDEMHRNYGSTVAIFSKIVENRERKDLNEKEKALSSEYEDRLISQILLKAYALSGTGQRLLESSRRQSGIALKFSNLLTFIFVVALMISILTNSVLLNRILRKRLGTIHKGTKIIGSGNLDYRIDLRSKDEFEDLSNEFNAMSDKLKKSFVSIEDLEKEITERKRVEEALLWSEKRFRLAAESSTDLIYEWDIKDRVDWFGKIDELLGYAPGEFSRTLEAWANSVHPDDRDRVMAAVKNHLEKNEPYKIEYRIRKKDGTYNYWWTRGTAIRDEKGNPYGWVGAVTDITERKQAEEALQKSESKYRTLVENLPQKIFLKDLDSIYISCNEHYANDLRIATADIAGKTDYDFYPKELAGKYRADDKRIMELGQTKEIEEKYIQDGRDVWVNTIKTPLMDDNGKVSGIFGIFWDITERKRAEEALRESEEQYRTVLDNIEYGYYEVDIAGNFTFFNDSLCRILGYSRDETTGMNNRQYMDKENTQKVYQAFNRVYATGEPYRSFDWEILRKDGTKRFVESSVSLLRNLKGERIGFRGIVRDITERKVAEEEREKLIHEIQDALAQIKKLSGLLPICASCKKIRDDKGYWNQIESYIRDHSEAEFSHGICPDCMKKLYPDFADNKNRV